MLTDDELVAGFEAGSLAEFPHADHVRLTIILLMRHGRGETLRRVTDGVIQLAALAGRPEKFHVTVTRAWIDLIESARAAHPDARDSGELVAACPVLLDRNALLRFYSRESLDSEGARTGWIPPDRAARIECEHASGHVPGGPASRR
jgi:hypothetical protein